MYSATLEFPAILSESEIYDLASALEGFSEGHISRRIDHDDNKPWFIQWYFSQQPEPFEIASRLAIQAKLREKEIDTSALIIAPVPDKNWLEEVYQDLKPFSVGPFFIYGSHYEGDVPEGQIGRKSMPPPRLAQAITARPKGACKPCWI